MTIKFYYLLSFCILGYQGQVSFIMGHSPIFQHYIRCIMCLCSTITFHNFKPKMYEPECREILNIAHRRIQATCPSNIYVIPFTRATSNLKNRNKMPKGVKRMKKEEEKRLGRGVETSTEKILRHALETNIKQHVRSAHSCLTRTALGYALVLHWSTAPSGQFGNLV